MAVTNIAPVAPKAQVKVAAKPTNVQFNPDYRAKGMKKDEPGKPVMAVGPLGVEAAGLAGGLPKWFRLFDLDKDGDPALAGVFQVLYTMADTQEKKDALVQGLGDAVGRINEFLAQVTPGDDQPQG